ncbi:beta/alpha barrel domain-containing protein [Rickettsia prowazekii]|uniref:Uncharacterized protein RP547 n=2 Tax=Rickettsia prowazekii TaxID=782 RepID=Y547_RICPR|nr:hypothetical protein [Rickettsia prowazekii]Q9ZD03.1 RecName: Full=Uncharacterized protein RP547 [Rickettsia prowazekii str. Madrid E]EOB09918.1 hypothetical protein H376_8630 [Rickettsia prowazekii str. GvF12]ADE30077.1 hypothetical protein rpr22_CDS528 [Rickettsia prowazekii str. Rp22]AFE49351.1 hypothetical protein M9W_02630 [Rickettsia prowazekii str. Chernikova]AFE50195.1 hypothetical protein M9Y_02635 [Rickettsia prowazekii str. Katsinyian]AFE51041.1 hypothetical protein MA1_02625 [R
MSRVYKIKNLEEARNFLYSIEEPLILTNDDSSIKYYGMLVIDYMFKTLRREFPEKVLALTVNVGQDHAALFTAIKLGYKNIVYIGASAEAKRLLSDLYNNPITYKV